MIFGIYSSLLDNRGFPGVGALVHSEVSCCTKLLAAHGTFERLLPGVGAQVLVQVISSAKSHVA